MTESVKFPGTGQDSPSEMVAYLHKLMNGVHDPRWVEITKEREKEGLGYGIKYLRADTATPNDQVVEMLLDAFGRGYLAGMVHEDSTRSSVSEAVDEQVWDVINDIRSRYAASDND